MTNEMRAGASRPGRRRVLKPALILVAALILVTIGRGFAGNDDHAWRVDDANFERSDAQIATHLLASVQGANDVVCAAIDRAFNGGYWGSDILTGLDASISPEAAETARWIGKSRIDRGVLDIARAGLASDDACTRRVAARIAGDVDSKRLAEDLAEELQSASTATRLAAVIALGHAEQDGSLPILTKLHGDSDRNVRLAALWAIGRLENEASAPMLIRLLESDGDADVRRIAAWALGRMD